MEFKPVLDAKFINGQQVWLLFPNGDQQPTPAQYQSFGYSDQAASFSVLGGHREIPEDMPGLEYAPLEIPKVDTGKTGFILIDPLGLEISRGLDKERLWIDMIKKRFPALAELAEENQSLDQSNIPRISACVLTLVQEGYKIKESKV